LLKPTLVGTENGIKKWKREISVGFLAVGGKPIKHYNQAAKLGDTQVNYGVVGCLGLRYYPEKAPIFFRLSYTPSYDIRQKQFLFIFAGVSVGYKF
jgi:hypothetical protein